MTTAEPDRLRRDLQVAFTACRQLAALVAAGRQHFDTDRDRRAHVRYLWIVAGTRLAAYRSAGAPPRDEGPGAHVAGLGFKLAQTDPEYVDDGIMWRGTEQHAMALARQIATLLERLPPHAIPQGQHSQSEQAPHDKR